MGAWATGNPSRGNPGIGNGRPNFNLGSIWAQTRAVHIKGTRVNYNMPAQRMQEQPLLHLQEVSKLYSGETPFLALDRISIEIKKGELVSIVGPSGSGKSTLLHMLGCLDMPTGGEIFVEGKAVSKMSDDAVADLRRDTIGFVFQAFNLSPTLSTFANVELPLMIRGVQKETRREIVERNLAAVGMSDKAHNLPSQLSGGQK